MINERQKAKFFNLATKTWTCLSNTRLYYAALSFSNLTVIRSQLMSWPSLFLQCPLQISWMVRHTKEAHYRQSEAECVWSCQVSQTEKQQGEQTAGSWWVWLELGSQSSRVPEFPASFIIRNAPWSLNFRSETRGHFSIPKFTVQYRFPI